MTQKVNLYESMVESGHSHFGVSAMVKLWSLAGLVLVAASVFSAGQVWIQHRKLALLEQDKYELSAQLEGLVQRASGWAEDPALVAGVQRLEAELQSKGRLLNALANETIEAEEGFSPFLLGLARRHVKGLWLREIAIEESGNILALKGSAIEPEAIPEFLEMLGEEPAFTGREFKTFGIGLGEDSDPVINFVLSTEEGAEL
jgi:MSHA biogenesis protein MshI